MESIVTIKCPNKIVANAIMILCEQALIQESVNAYLQKIELDEGNSINEEGYPDIESAESDYSAEHTITFELA